MCQNNCTIYSYIVKILIINLHAKQMGCISSVNCTYDDMYVPDNHSYEIIYIFLTLNTHFVVKFTEQLASLVFCRTAVAFLQASLNFFYISCMLKYNTIQR